MFKGPTSPPSPYPDAFMKSLGLLAEKVELFWWVQLRSDELRDGVHIQ